MRRYDIAKQVFNFYKNILSCPFLIRKGSEWNWIHRNHEKRNFDSCLGRVSANVQYASSHCCLSTTFTLERTVFFSFFAFGANAKPGEYCS